jgi:glutamate dehydrogenase
MMANKNDLRSFVKSILKKLNSKSGPAVKAFAERFFEHGVFEDLRNYDPESLAKLAGKGFAFFKTRKPGPARVRIYNPTGTERLEKLSIIEVANDDMPFLVDSILALLGEKGHTIELALHPVLTNRRSPKGVIQEVLKPNELIDDSSLARDSFVHVHVARIASETERKALEGELASVLKDVRTVVLDWQTMRGRMEAAVEEYQHSPPPIAVDELAEAIQFLQWLIDNNFTFLGLREYDFKGSAANGRLKPVEGSGLGILRDPDVKVLRRGRELVSYTPELREFLMRPAPLIITKANVRATVHRRTHMDYIGIKRFDSKGKLKGELRVVGMFTSVAYTRSPRFIPFLRRKLADVMEKSGHKIDSHSGKAMLNILETYPRDELFQISRNLLSETAMGIIRLNERPRPKLFVRVDRFDRFVSVLAYIPRDRYTSDVRQKTGALLAEAYKGGVSAFYPSFPEGALVRVHFIIGRYDGTTPSPDIADLERQLVEITRTWDDRLSRALNTSDEPGDAAATSRMYEGAFSRAYEEAYSALDAIKDIARFATLEDESDVALEFYRRPGADAAQVSLKLYRRGKAIALSDRLPILENMGLRAHDEYTFKIKPKEASYVLHDITLTAADGSPIDLASRQQLLEDTFQAIWQGKAENDGHNGLVLKGGLTWRQVALLRTVARYLRQAGIPFSPDYIYGVLNRHAGLAADLWALFEARFELGTSGNKQKAAERRIVGRIEDALADVPNLDDDRIIRRFMNVILSTLRTNFYQRTEGGDTKPVISLKIDSAKIDDLPEPKPYREIFVYAPDVEGIHLRGGPIARGGLRWSDRPEDFRTEVLGLAKAQQVKNAVIVPVGAKGGFVPKQMPANPTREEFMAEGIRCYTLFINSLLDVTDNLRGDDVILPKDVLRLDGDDPYLVVAADKGTATFSDIANGISEQHGFWLGDAFASGGSAGYDHKKMGITARGGWEAVKRHFREMDIDIQKDPFRVVGCGDMSGDVFGNGMLLSKAIKLVAAFDHRDIIIDPDPDPAKSWKERKRLFGLARSSWQDYDKKLISKGGGIFPRSLKTIPLSAEIRDMIGTSEKNLAPNDLIRALLKAPSDLLWFGGIGTYVRASSESNADAGDRANDILRITALEVGAKVIGEGANLGFTQNGRIEFSANGGCINTDAIDNSAGVNSSDVEVNIKIALGAAEEKGKLTRKARNTLLVKMTDEVAGLVLRNNYLQTLAITLMERAGSREFGFLVRMMKNLESRRELDRVVEDLPDDVELAEREAAGKAFTRPELAVLLAYAKLVLFSDLMAGDTPSEPYFQAELMRYFPREMQNKYSGEITNHRLAPEIISTMLSNSMINRGGAAFVFRMMEETGAGVDEIAKGFTAARDVMGLLDLNGEINALDNKIPSGVQVRIYATLQALLRREASWFVRNADWSAGLESVISHYRKGYDELLSVMPSCLVAEDKARLVERTDELVEHGVPKAIAAKISALRFVSRAPDIIFVATRTGRKVRDIAEGFFAVGSQLGVDRLVLASVNLAATDYYERIAINRGIETVLTAHRSVAAQMFAGRASADKAYAAWLSKNGEEFERVRATIEDMMAGQEMTLARLSVAASALNDLVAV